MEFTGERFVPIKSLLNDEIAFEHLHRYHSASELVKGKIVLDIACGEGYGAAILAEHAVKVIGVDIDPACITYARNKYPDSKLEFIEGSAGNIPLPDNSIDIAVSYETIEHLSEEDQRAFLKEIGRVLKKDGKLIISTPDQTNYSERYEHKNEFHIKEFTSDEFFTFLSHHFKYTKAFSQGYEIVDAITELTPREVGTLQVCDWNRETKPFSRMYLIAVCSNEKLNAELSFSSVVFQVNKEYLPVMDRIVEMEAHILELGAWGRRIDKEAQEKDELIRQQQAAIQQNGESSQQYEESIRQLREEIGVLKNKMQLLSFDRGTKVKAFEESNVVVAKQAETITFLKNRFEEQYGQIRQLEKREADSVNISNEQKGRISDLNYQLDAVNGRLNEIYGSEGWKLLKVYYNFKGKVLPEKSRRYKLLKDAFNKLRGKKGSYEVKALPGSKGLPVGVTGGEADIYDVIEFTHFEEPAVSIVLPAYNGWHLTHKCLASIKKNTLGVAYEVIIADDASSDETKNIKEYVKNIVVIRNEKNLEFLYNCNNAAGFAKGKYILFLNNDTEVMPDWLSTMVDLMEKDESIGMTGSKLIYPNGKLQEAGAIVWKDASGWNFGHRQDPGAPEFNYVKEADYISGASILIRTSLWKEIGGFDTRYAPAYSEDSDLAFEVRKHGYKVVYQPLSEVIHYEGYTHGTDNEEGIKEGGIKGYQKLNAVKFHEKWKTVLETEHFPNGEKVYWARDRSRNKKTILVIDHYVPHFDKDAGSRTSYQLLQLFAEMNYNVKFIGDNFFKHEPYTTVLQQMGIEVLYGAWYAENWQKWIKDNGEMIDYVFLNRPHISIKYIDFIKNNTAAKIVYYGHDLHFVREQRQYEIEKTPKLLNSIKEWQAIETKLIQKSDTVLTLSCDEKEIMESELSAGQVQIIPAFFYKEFKQPVLDFSRRKDVLFIGGFNHKPNVDAVHWFVREVWPKVIASLSNVRFIIVGSLAPPDIIELECETISVRGYVTDNDLNDIYDNVKMAVVPLRYGAGVKGKTVEAMYQGLPIVSTSFGIEGLANIGDVLQPFNEAAAFASEVISLYNDGQRLMSLSEKEIEYAQRFFSNDTVRDLVAKIFKQ